MARWRVDRRMDRQMVDGWKDGQQDQVKVIANTDSFRENPEVTLRRSTRETEQQHWRENLTSLSPRTTALVTKCVSF